jgi:hypothetical protein
MFVETMYNDVDITILLYPEIKGKTNKTEGHAEKVITIQNQRKVYEKMAIISYRRQSKFIENVPISCEKFNN